MKVERNITVELTDDEITEIIIKHLNEVEDIKISDVSFKLEREYSGFQDERGTMMFKGASCEGVLSHEDR
jgi:hypothetical protein